MPGLTSASATLPEQPVREGRYELSFARTEAEVDAILRLRFEVFNLELGEGLDASFATGRDEDPFDAVCHHLIIREHGTGEIVGCYRMQTAEMAAKHIGFYCDTEFDLSDLPASVVGRGVELGRACVAARHRSVRVLFLLWKGLALYGMANGKRYFFGCSSVKSQDPRVGLGLMEYLRREGHVHPEIEVRTRPGFECVSDGHPIESDGSMLPDLFRAYLHHGAKICSPPAIDRQFKTIDYLMLSDLFTTPARMLRNFVR